ncbi:MAG: hypothetical protein IJW82_01015 [Clostridia bacterium]|nr:hypothetical protein [Clostridia bacterium]
MKNLLIKIIQITQVVLSAIFVIMLMATILGLIPVETLDGKVVCDPYLKILLSIMGIVYVVLSVMLVMNAVNNANKLKYVKINGNKDTVSSINVGVIKSFCVKKSKLLNKSIRVSKVSVYSNELNNVVLNILISAKTDDINHTTEKFRKILIDTFKTVLGIEFSSINFKVKKIKSGYEPNVDEIEDELILIEKENKEKEQLATLEVENNTEKVETVIKEDKVETVVNEETKAEPKVENKVENIETENQDEVEETKLEEKEDENQTLNEEENIDTVCDTKEEDLVDTELENQEEQTEEKKEI